LFLLQWRKKEEEREREREGERGKKKNRKNVTRFAYEISDAQSLKCIRSSISIAIYAISFVLERENGRC